MSEYEQTLRATLDVPFECSFTKAGAMNGLPTYRVPPVPTIQGLLYAALGRPSLLQATQYGELENDVRDQEEAFREQVREECSFGIRIVEDGTEHTNLRSRHKASTSDAERAFITYVAQREALESPTYRIYIGGPTRLLSAFKTALEDPERLLYLGRSDDLVDVRDIEIHDITHVDEPTTLECVIPGPGEDPTLLPIEPDERDYPRKDPARVETVCLTGGDVDSYYETEDGDQFVYLT
jgi:CRISPR-associated Cas5-like protein